jgi:hypothetical protein
VSESITVEGIKGPDIPLDVITPGMLSGQVADTIAQAGIDATHAQEAAQNAAKIFSKPTKPTLAVDNMKIGDLWFDTSSGNKPYRYQLVGPPINANDWVSIRDATLSAAFPGGGNLLDGSYLDKDVIHTKFLQAGLIEAKDILTGTITAESGVIGSLSANDITTGTLSADRIAAGAISASKIFLGDTENLVDEPHFAKTWPGTTGARPTRSVLPSPSPTCPFRAPARCGRSPATPRSAPSPTPGGWRWPPTTRSTPKGMCARRRRAPPAPSSCC